MDRIDIHIDVPAISFGKLHSKSGQLDATAMREDVVRAGGVQAKRFSNDKAMTKMTEFGLSARAHDKICKVARTIAGLANSENIQPEHIAEAISYRKLDRRL